MMFLWILGLDFGDGPNRKLHFGGATSRCFLVDFGDGPKQIVAFWGATSRCFLVDLGADSGFLYEFESERR